MSGFLYFLPGHVGDVTDETLLKFGVHYVAERHEIGGPRSVVLGPAGQSGVLIAHKTVSSERVKYDKDNQEWLQNPLSNVWVGKWTTDIIKPSDLQRETMVEGSGVVLENGTKWKAAYARRFADLEGGNLGCFCPLPKGRAFTSKGWQPSRIARRYRRFAELAARYWEEMCEAASKAESDTFSWESKYADALAVAALTANYRVAETELSLLEAYGDQSRQSLIRVALDTDNLERWQKKRIELGGDGTVFYDGLLLAIAD